MTPVSIRIGRETSKQLHAVLARAYRAGDLPLVRRVSALLAIGRGETVDTIAQSLGASPSTVYGWLTTFLVEGVVGLAVQWRGGLGGAVAWRAPVQADADAAGAAAGDGPGGTAGGWVPHRVLERAVAPDRD
jgi:hypothetical protein